MSLTLLLGGARSGKSKLAASLAERTGAPVVVIATAEARDAEMTARIEAHKRARPAGWGLIEEPVELAGALSKAPPGACAVVDCLTLWVANLMEFGCDDEAVLDRAQTVLAVAATRASATIAVSNEVGSGIVPAHAAARRYRDLLGEVNALCARGAERALLVVAGRVLPLLPTDDVASPGRLS
jgi:adenosyl cobinamide kinase/adenosyl cobinamide phosphate guanylyltransferase